MAEHKLVDGIQIPLSAEEIAQRQADEIAWNAGAFDRSLASLRAKRNSLLAQTDYLALSDNTVQSEEAIKAFLFALSPAIALSKAPLAQAVASACICAISCAVSSI